MVFIKEHESLMIVACRNKMCGHESDDEQETIYDKPLSDGVLRLRRGQFSNDLHCYVNNIIKVVSITYTPTIVV